MSVFYMGSDPEELEDALTEKDNALDQALKKVWSLDSQVKKLRSELEQARKSEDTQCQIRYMTTEELENLQSECIRLGYGSYVDGVFELREPIKENGQKL